MKRLLVISDMHVGSNVSVMPDEVTIDEGERERTVCSNAIQKTLYSKWEEMVDEVGRVDAVLNLGDSIDGYDYRGRGVGAWTTDLNKQIEVAANLLSMVKTNKYLGVQGSYYHVGDNLSSDAAVLSALGGTFGDELVACVDKSRIHMSHAVGVTSSGSAYRTTPIAREMMLASLNEAEYGKFDVILRGHAHYYVRVSFSNSTGLICPCWKGRDAFVGRCTLAFNPHCGYIVLNVDDTVVVDSHIFTLEGEQLIKSVEV